MQASTRLLFPGSQAELTADQASVVKQLLAAAPAGDSTSFNVVAFATGAAGDPSVARRLSLSRALAVRNALIDGGIPSPAWLPKART